MMVTTLDQLRSCIAWRLGMRPPTMVERREPFQWNEFVDLAAHGRPKQRGLEDRIELAQWYARWRLPKLGKGAARAVYRLSSRYALKVALDVPGTLQSMREISASERLPASAPIARVRHHDQDGVWLLSDLARGVHDHQEFMQLAGIDIVDLGEQLLEIRHDASKGRSPRPGLYDDLAVQTWKVMQVEDLAVVDIKRLEHWGVTPDRRLVLLDYGYVA